MFERRALQQGKGRKENEKVPVERIAEGIIEDDKGDIDETAYFIEFAE